MPVEPLGTNRLIATCSTVAFELGDQVLELVDLELQPLLLELEQASLLSARGRPRGVVGPLAGGRDLRGGLLRCVLVRLAAPDRGGSRDARREWTTRVVIRRDGPPGSYGAGSYLPVAVRLRAFAWRWSRPSLVHTGRGGALSHRHRRGSSLTRCSRSTMSPSSDGRRSCSTPSRCTSGRDERWLVLGANGTGKTTLLSIASMYEHPSCRRGDGARRATRPHRRPQPAAAGRYSSAAFAAELRPRSTRSRS